MDNVLKQYCLSNIKKFNDNFMLISNRIIRHNANHYNNIKYDITSYDTFKIYPI